VSKRIAPTLTTIVERKPGWLRHLMTGNAAGELRALLAVARAARGECGCGPGDNCPMQRALARLDKVSK